MVNSLHVVGEAEGVTITIVTVVTKHQNLFARSFRRTVLERTIAYAISPIAPLEVGGLVLMRSYVNAIADLVHGCIKHIERGSLKTVGDLIVS